jgi:hypothetical protein
MVIYFFLPSLF